MTSSGPLHPRRLDGSDVDATFELHTVPVFDLVYHHKAGGRDSPRAINSDYHEGLEAILGKLGRLGTTILGISIDSTVARELEPAARELQLDYPIVLTSATNIPELRLDITRAQKPVARRKDAKPGGGNDQKRIRITLTSDNPNFTYDRLVSALTDRADLTASAQSTRVDAPGERKRGRHGGSDKSGSTTVTKSQLDPWVLDALRDLNGSATLVDICRQIWRDHQAELERSGDRFFTWQYDVRWAAYRLRENGRLRPASESPRGVWELA